MAEIDILRLMQEHKQRTTPAKPQAAIVGKESQELLRTLIRGELILFKASLVSEVKASKDECLANLQSIKDVLMQSENKVEAKGQPRTSEVNGTTLVMSVEPSSPKAAPSSTDEVHGEPEVLWADFEEAVDEIDEQHNLYVPVLEKFRHQKSVWHHVLEHFKMAYLVDMAAPTSCLARVTYAHAFVFLQTMLILVNTSIMGYEADATIKAALKGEDPPEWLDACNRVFTIVFTVELAFRIFALRTWFFVAPTDWAWNFFDVFVVTISLITDFVFTGVNLSFIRSLRMLRAIRAVRIIRVLRFFRRLRQMLFSILSSMSSLIWFFVFLGGVMFMFTILLLQGLVFAIVDMPESNSTSVNPELNAGIVDMAQIEEHYGSMGDSLFSLLCAVTGGRDWADLRAPLLPAGEPYVSAYLIYVLFVTVGIINVLTGVFVASSADSFDESLIVLNEQVKVERYVKQMMDLFRDMDIDKHGRVDWISFRKAMTSARMRAYFSSVDLEPTHARLIFDLLDVKKEGGITLEELLMGFMRLKGEAKAIDARTIQRQISMIPKLLDPHFKKIAAFHGSL